MALLLAQMGARRPDHAELVAQLARLDPSDQSEAALQLRRLAPTFKDVFTANNHREQLRWEWRAFFDRFDVLIAPITATAAFMQDESEPMSQRTTVVNGTPVPYFAQLFWAGLATCAYLPATVAPIGLTSSGLPVGLQIIGPEMGDRTTIRVAAYLAKLIGGYRAPPTENLG